MVCTGRAEVRAGAATSKRERGSMRKTAIAFLVSALAALLVAGAAVAATQATEGNDTLYGGSGDDAIGGLGGDDRIFGYAGDDKLYGGAGADLLYGGDGTDTIFGGEGNDRVFGQAGADTLRGNGGNDRIYGAGGSDVIRSGGDGKVDLVYCGYGEDTVILRDDTIKRVDRYAEDCEKVIGDPKRGDNPTLRSFN